MLEPHVTVNYFCRRIGYITIPLSFNRQVIGALYKHFTRNIHISLRFSFVDS